MEGIEGIEGIEVIEVIEGIEGIEATKSIKVGCIRLSCSCICKLVFGLPDGLL
ncbi:hypothetical protein D3C85_1799510 [compost metagenome]